MEKVAAPATQGRRETGTARLDAHRLAEPGEARGNMAARKNLSHDERTRAKIQTSQLVNRLQSFANGEVELTRDQIKAIGQS